MTINLEIHGLSKIPIQKSGHKNDRVELVIIPLLAFIYVNKPAIMLQIYYHCDFIDNYQFIGSEYSSWGEEKVSKMLLCPCVEMKLFSIKKLILKFKTVFPMNNGISNKKYCILITLCLCIFTHWFKTIIAFLRVKYLYNQITHLFCAYYLKMCIKSTCFDVYFYPHLHITDVYMYDSYRHCFFLAVSNAIYFKDNLEKKSVITK